MYFQTTGYLKTKLKHRKAQYFVQERKSRFQCVYNRAIGRVLSTMGISRIAPGQTPNRQKMVNLIILTKFPSMSSLRPMLKLVLNIFVGKQLLCLNEILVISTYICYV